MSEHTAPPVLPFDIIGNIIDILFNDDTKSLQYVKDFSLVCHSFLPLCRKHIFSSITIDIGEKPLKYRNDDEALWQLLLETPDIARYVHKLKICARPYEHKSKCFLEPVSPQLTGLQSLTIFNSNLWHPMLWSKLSSSSQRSLLNLMHLPTLTHLDVSRISSFPKSNLIFWANVKHLSAHDLDILDDGVASSPLCRKPLELQTLHISINDPRLLILEATCSDGRPFLDLTGLEKVSIDFSMADGPAPIIQDIFRKARRLRDVSLRIDGM